MADGPRLDATGEPLDYERLDPEWRARRRAEVQTRMFEELPPGAIGRWGRRSRSAASTVRLAQFVLCALAVLGLFKLLTGEWFHGGALLATLVLNLALQLLFALLNGRWR
jgi:hypothetical protein